MNNKDTPKAYACTFDVTFNIYLLKLTEEAISNSQRTRNRMGRGRKKEDKRLEIVAAPLV